MARNIVDYKDSPCELNEQRGVGLSSNMEDTLKSSKEEIRISKVDNGKIMQEQEKQVEVIVILIQSFSELQRQGPLHITHEQEDRNIGAYGSRSYGGQMLDINDMIRDGKLLDIPDRRGDGHKNYYSYGSDMHHDHHRYHTYKRSDRGYLVDDFKKEKTPTLDGEMNKS